jgi:hypothetical protein
VFVLLILHMFLQPNRHFALKMDFDACDSGVLVVSLVPYSHKHQDLSLNYFMYEQCNVIAFIHKRQMDSFLPRFHIQ